MAKRKGISISLAAKCQLLFGLAVLVIIAGALAVPWQRMEQLAKQPNIKAGSFAADVVFREAHSGVWEAARMQAAETGPGLAATAASTLPVATASTLPATASTLPAVAGTLPATGSSLSASSRPGWDDAALSDANYPPPRIFVAASPTGGFVRQPGRAEDAIALTALRRFREHAQETEYGEVASIPQRNGETLRIYRYAAAIRLDVSCLGCHTDYRAWVPSVVTVPVMPATTRATSGPEPAATQADRPRGALLSPVAVKVSDAGAGNGIINWPAIGVVRVDVPFQTDENQLLLNRIVIVVAGMLGGALAIVVFYLITSRLILQPVRVLKNTAEKVAKGDLNIRSAISTGDEFQHLSETFNAMLVTLQASQVQLEATNRSLDTRVGELAQSNVDLYEANRLKSEFLTNVTHELRTPLNAIIGFADLLADTAKDAKLQRYLENIRTSAKQLLDLINDLLDLAKIEAGKLVLREGKVNVADVCEAMANFMRPLAQKKNIALELAVDADMPLVTTDPGRFQQILYNFLSNAIKFTPNEGRVTINARNEAPAGRVALSAVEGGEATAALLPGERERAGDEVNGEVSAIRIAITDTGPGISAEDQRHVFEKFRQLDGSVTRPHSGSGLGLTISRELANMLGARVELASTLGKGATFSLIIPVRNPNHTLELGGVVENA